MLEVVIIVRYSLYRMRREGFLENSACPPSCERPLKIQHHLLQLLAIRNLIPDGADKIHSAVGMGKIRCVLTGPNVATDAIVHLPIAQSVCCAFPIDKKHHSVFKSSSPPLETALKFALSAFANSWWSKKMPHTELCPLQSIRFPIANNWRCCWICEGSHRIGQT